MVMKKMLALMISAVLLSACNAVGSGTDNAGHISSVRAKNGMMISEAEAKQQSRQRQAELEESETRHAKTRATMGTAREGIDTVREGANLIWQLKNMF